MITGCCLWCTICHIGIEDDTAGAGCDQWTPGEVAFSPCHAQKVIDPVLRWVRGGKYLWREMLRSDKFMCTSACELMGGFRVSIISTVLRQSVEMY